MKYAFAISYADLGLVSIAQTYQPIFKLKTYQQIAVLGIVCNILGLSPLKNPPQPFLAFIILAACIKPFAFLISGSCTVPRVCSNVLITSRGVVTAAAAPPANPPATQCVRGSYDLEGFIIRDNDS